MDRLAAVSLYACVCLWRLAFEHVNICISAYLFCIMPLSPDEPHTDSPTEGKEQPKSVYMYVHAVEYIGHVKMLASVACHLPNCKGERG